jgi:hypothetical protein
MVMLSATTHDATGPILRKDPIRPVDPIRPRCMRLSIQGRRVLEALGRTHDGQLTVADLLVQIRQPETSVLVAKASLSRTLRRLWARGLVELVTRDRTGETLTAQVAFWRRQFETVRSAPEAYYRTYRERLATPADDAFGSAAAYVASFRAEAERPSAAVRAVGSLGRGRAAVNTLTHGESEKASYRPRPTGAVACEYLHLAGRTE